MPSPASSSGSLTPTTGSSPRTPSDVAGVAALSTASPFSQNSLSPSPPPGQRSGSQSFELKARRPKSRSSLVASAPVHPAAKGLTTEAANAMLIEKITKKLKDSMRASNKGGAGAMTSVGGAATSGTASVATSQHNVASPPPPPSLSSLHVNYWRHPLTIVGMLVALILFSLFFVVEFSPSPYQGTFPRVLVVEAVLVVVLTVWSAWLIGRDQSLAQRQVFKKVHELVEQLAVAYPAHQDLKVPMSETLTCYRTLRDDQEKLVPAALLVKGDVILLQVGDVAPAKICYIDYRSSSPVETRYLNAGDHLKSSFFTYAERRAQTRYDFWLLETPVLHTIDVSLATQRPRTLLKQQLTKIMDVVRRYGVVLVGLSFAFGIVRTAVDPLRSQTWFFFLLMSPAYVAMSFLPLISVTAWILVRTWGNTKMLSVFEQLEQSTTPFDDLADEFDEEAPAPVKEIKLTTSELMARFLKSLFYGDSSSLQSTHLLETLSSATMICSLDREATLTSCFPCAEQVLFFSGDAEPKVLDIAEDESYENGFLFEDRDWQTHIASLKPLGLNLLANTDCEYQSDTSGGATSASSSPPLTKFIELHSKHRPFCKYVRLEPARQRCVCSMAKSIGFDETAMQAFTRGASILISTEVASMSVPNEVDLISVNFQALKDEASGELMVFAEGHPRMLLEYCLEFWNGRELLPLGRALRKKLLDLFQNASINDAVCVAYSYSPITSDDESLKALLATPGKTIVIEDTTLHRQPGSPTLSTESTNILDALRSQIFLCIVSYNLIPKEDVKEFIEDLRVAGIRFVYFSEAGERESKAFAERLGLETDWNSCILLSATDARGGRTSGYLEPHDIKAKLPRGIEQIRSHLTDIDDIPLHVSLFADSSPQAVQEMIRVFQENGEVVLCTGNSLNIENTGCFAASDLALSVDAFPMKLPNKKPTKFGIAAGFVSLPCSLTTAYETSPYALSQTISEARRFAANMTQTFVFFLGCKMALASVLTLCDCLLLPPIFSGFHILWLNIVIFPAISFPFLFSPISQADIMKVMPLKNKDHLKDVNRQFGHFLGRFGLVILFTVLIHMLVMFILLPVHPWLIFSSANVDEWMELGTDSHNIVVVSQSASLLAFVIFIMATSTTFMQRTLYIYEYVPFRNVVWVFSCLAVLCIQAAFSVPFIAATSINIQPIWWILVVVFAGCVPIILVNEWFKSHDRAEYVRSQKRSKLEFNTKLGCYSPV